MTTPEPDIDSFWNALRQRLAATPLGMSLEQASFYSQPEWRVYRMHYDSLGAAGSLPGCPYRKALAPSQHC